MGANPRRECPEAAMGGAPRDLQKLISRGRSGWKWREQIPEGQKWQWDELPRSLRDKAREAYSDGGGWLVGG